MICTERELKFHKTFINVARQISSLSRCVSVQVGAVLVKDERILSIGYNGTPSGYRINCNDIFNKNDFNREEHHNFSEKYEIHAEMNVILFAAKTGISIKDSILYVTTHPCFQCIKNLTQSGVKTIIYDKEYDLITKETHKEINEFLRDVNMELEALNNLKVRNE